MKLHQTIIEKFQQKILAHYKKYGRLLPWRGSATTPYQILVSEIMLQQTQTERVIPKYEQFIKQFPNFSILARATNTDILRLWSGLGYNRRALFLKRCAQVVVEEFKGRLPNDVKTLVQLPGIGNYTASAVIAFAYNRPTTLIETNVRTVFIHEFFKEKVAVHDKNILPLVTQTLYLKSPRIWYWALMDYGSFLKKTVGNVNIKSKHYTKQSKFAGSNRQVRGMIIKALLQKPQSLPELLSHLKKPKVEVEKIIEKLEKEHLVITLGHQVSLIS